MTAPLPPPTLLVVDDVAENIEVLNNILEQDYRVKVATNGEKALSIVMSDQPPDLILLDIMMPGIDGYEVCRRIKANPDRRSIPIMFVTSMEDQEDEALGLELGAEDYITKPFNPYLVMARVKTHLALYDQTRELERKVNERTRELQNTRLQIIQRLGKAAEFRDNETGFHVTRMSRYSRLIALAAGLPEAQAELLLLSAPMHDIGKIGTPDYVLLKPGKLDAAEWAIMQQHAAIGAEIIGDHDDPLLTMARSIAASHHEKWDGSGYPQGLKGQDIPLVARIVAIADVFDALTSLRPYKAAWPVAQAHQAILDDAGRHFDPELIQAYVKALPEMLEVKDLYVEHSVEIPPQRMQPVEPGKKH
jgi:putative two-component system response regulator